MTAFLQYLIGPLLVAVVTGIFIYIGRRVDAKASKEINDANREQAARIEERKVDREEFDSITRELRTSLSDVREELRKVRGELEVEVKARKEADSRAERAERRAAAAEQRATRLERRVTQLEQVLRDNNITVPPVPNDGPHSAS